MRRHGGADKPRQGKHQRQQHSAFKRHGRAGAYRHLRRTWRCMGRRMLRTRQRQIEWQRHQQMQRRPDKTGAPPTQPSLKRSGQRPAHGAGKAGDQGDAGNHIARVLAIEPHQGGKRGLVQTARHGHAHHHPGRKQAPRAGSQTQARQPGGKHDVAQRQDRAPAQRVNGAPGARPQKSRDHQTHRKRRKGRGHRHTQVTRHGCRQNGGQVVA